MLYSLDGQVKLFDLRGADIAYTTWDLHPKSLSAFDVHPISGVFATYVVFYYYLRAR
jgi:regulator-associated protein of mTOR